MRDEEPILVTLIEGFGPNHDRQIVHDPFCVRAFTAESNIIEKLFKPISEQLSEQRDKI